MKQILYESFVKLLEKVIFTLVSKICKFYLREFIAEFIDI